MRVERVDTERAYEDALGVRHDVFVDEQGVPEDLEVDEYEESATHFVGYDGGEPVAAARLREYEPGVGKVERVAVRKSRRGEGFGAAVMDAVEETAVTEAFDELYLHAQLHVEAFYDERGYDRDGEVFTEAGIEHVAMRKPL